MANYNITLPAMGEGVIEATINKWLVAAGDRVKEDDPLVEVATDKVDTEIPSPASGVVVSITAPEGTIAKVGAVLAIVEDNTEPPREQSVKVEKEVERIRETIDEIKNERKETEAATTNLKSRTPSGKFISPLVRSIAGREGVSHAELDTIRGTGMDGRITRDDILQFIEERKKKAVNAVEAEKAVKNTGTAERATAANGEKSERVEKIVAAGASGSDEVIEMDRVRKLIAEHMVMSKRTSPHVTSFIDVDVTRMVRWRDSVKDIFLKREGQKLTFTPIFIEAASRTLYEFPMVNVSVDGTRIIIRKNINIGMAVALPDGNLIVPVIKNANEKSLTGLARSVNDLAERARKRQLKPDEITGGTFSITNFGSYDNLAGTPIINQPQSAILGTGAIRKRPAVLETPDGDVIAIRHIMILSLSYDHRVIDGALAGKFLHRIRELLENYSPDQF